MRPELISVNVSRKYIIELGFDDGTLGELDVSKLANRGVFKAWDENDLFFQAYISESGAIAWNDELDIDPLNAYLSLKGISFEKWKQNQSLYAAN